MNEINLDKIKHVHFIGIGGIGVSAVARMMLVQGKNVSGSDVSESRVTKELMELGAHISIGHKAGNIPREADLMIHTIAVSPNNPEFEEATRRDIPAFSYPEFLGIISENMFTIAVSGTHGKTTTTAMLADVLWSEGINPTVIVGSLLKNAGSNFIAGDFPAHILGEEYDKGVLVVEACEYRRSFINLNPRVLIITNIDNDHLDYYKDIGDIISAFNEVACKVPENGFIIANTQNSYIKRALKGVKAQIIDYSVYDASDLSLKVPGTHNRENAKAVLALVSVLRSDPAKAEEALDDFSGTWRRFEFKGGTKGGAIIYDDYGHHPTEVKATLSGAREKFPDRKITVVFQPHLYSRTKLLLDDFARAFGDADNVILAPIYAAREEFDPNINSEMLAEKIRMLNGSVSSFTDLKNIVEYLKHSLKHGDILITMGAGDVYKVGEALTE
ncbi:MAG: UDP-N-acetylmuramate--L-alanine ligase [Candidatus Paceibacterota bacterium]|jgi:UDP-N-acetylmuramate--alanine ligase